VTGGRKKEAAILIEYRRGGITFAAYKSCIELFKREENDRNLETPKGEKKESPREKGDVT